MNKLKDLRKTFGVTQVRLAKLSGVSRWTIQMIEAGEYKPNPKESVALEMGIKSHATKIKLELEKSFSSKDWV